MKRNKTNDELTREEIIARQFLRAQQVASSAGTRKTEELKSNSDYQRRVRLGREGRTKEAIEIQAKHILQRQMMNGDTLPIFDDVKRSVAERAQRLRNSGK